MIDELAGWLEQALRNPAFRAAYDDARARSLLLNNLIALRTARHHPNPGSRTDAHTQITDHRPGKRRHQPAVRPSGV
jgi:hypothetical protein